MIGRGSQKGIRRFLPKRQASSVYSTGDVRYIAGLTRLFSEVVSVPGHVIELGTGSGRNAVIFGNLIQMYRQDEFRRYYGFDTFTGYPPQDIHSSPHLSAKNHRYSYAACSNLLERSGVSQVCGLILGDIVDELPRFVSSPPVGAKFSPQQLVVALLYIDCNALRAASRALEILTPYLAPGSLIAVDETIQGGETAALLNWSKRNGQRLEAGVFGSVISSFVRYQPKSV